MTAKDLRFQARQALTGNWPIAAGATLIATILGGVVNSSGITFNEQEEVVITPAVQETLADYLPLILGVSLGVIVFTMVFVFFFTAIVGIGYHRFILKMFDGEPPEIKELFGQFSKGIYMNTVKTAALRTLYVAVGYFLLIIPGILAEYSYAMVPYILIDHPELSPKECLNVSRRMMEGNRWRLFCLRISFIGWNILSGFTFGIGNLFLSPYIYSAEAAFYREICNNVNIVDCI